MMHNLPSKESNESNKEFIERLYEYKRLYNTKFTFEEMAYVIAKETGILHDRRTWGRKYKEYCKNISSELQAEQQPIEEIKDWLLEAQKERYKISDERTQARAYMRRIAREETLKEIGKSAAEIIAKTKQLLPCISTSNEVGSSEAILELSDWHYGIEVNNHWNTFSPEICKKRIRKLLDEVEQFCTEFSVKTIHLVNLNDLIAGRIHSTIRLESRCDVITQIIEVSEILSEFISELTSKGFEVHYYDCLDNHSRIEPIKSESLDLESLTRIIPWYLSTRLANNSAVTVHENEFGDDIITFKVLDGKYNVAGVHGHKDRPRDVVDNLTMMTKRNYDLILAAHLHHFSCEEKNEILVVNNGSLMGTDTYAKDLRLSAKPSQNIILVTQNSVADLIHRIILD